MIKIGIVGATGYAGGELIQRLLTHPEARITSVSAKIDKPLNIAEIFPSLKHRLELVCGEPDVKKISQAADLIFLALPHTVSMELVPKFLKAGKKVIDLSADYRAEAKHNSNYSCYIHRVLKIQSLVVVVPVALS